MTKTLLKLQRTLWKRTVAGNGAAIGMIVLVAVYAILGLITLSALLAAGLIDGKSGVLSGVVATGTIAYLIAAIMWPSGEGQIQPASFAVLPVQARDILPALALSTVLQSRGIIAIVCTTITAIIASVLYPLHIIPVIWCMLALALIITLLLGELVSAAASSSSSRVSKERMSIIATVGFIVIIVGYNLLMGSGSMLSIEALGLFMRWTPLASTAATIEAVAAGQWLLASVFFLMTIVYAVLGGLLWLKLIQRSLIAPLDRGGHRTKKKKDSKKQSRLLFLPGVAWSPSGAVFSRSVLYLFRDSRLLASLIVLPVLAVLFAVQSITVDSFMIYFGLVFMAVFGGVVATNDFGYDGPATWLNIVSGASTKALLLARHAASLFPAVIILALYSIVAFVLAENTIVTLLIIVISLGILITTAGVALTVSVFNPYATAPPGTSPWGDRSGYSGAAFLAAFATMFLGWIPSLPGIVLTAFGYHMESVWMLVLGQALALIFPAGIYLLLARFSIRRVQDHLPEIFDKVKTFVS